MVIKRSSVIKLVVAVVTIYMLGYFDLVLPPGNVTPYRIAFGSLAILLSLFTLGVSRRNKEMKKRLRFANLFFAFYVPIILVTAVLSMIWYRYNLLSILAVSAPYFYLLYAYPLLYIFSMDNTYDKYIKTTVILTILMLLLKAFAWYMYNYQGVTFFPTILFKNEEGWVRNGVLRVDTGALFGVAFCYLLCEFFIRKKRLAGVLAIGVALFSVFITQYRYLEIVLLLAALMIFLTSTHSSKRQLIRILLLAMICVAFIALGGLDAIVSSFSVENEEFGSSTSARFETIDYFLSKFKGIHILFGFGFLSSYSTAALAFVTRSATEIYWLEDLGLLGGFFEFGLLSILIYVPLFYRSIKACTIQIRNKMADRAFLTSIVGYMILCCIMMNILDRQRIYDTAFYIAIISFIASQNETDRVNTPLIKRFMD